MRKVKLSDNFYPGLSIYGRMRQSPESVVTRYANLLEKRNVEPTNVNIRLLLNTSRQLYVFVTGNGQEELNQYELEVRKKGKLIRGGFFPPFELVFELLSAILDYIQKHPRETLETATDLAILADYVEKKLGSPGGSLFRKVSERSSKLRKQLSRLSKQKHGLKKTRRRRRNISPRKSTSSYIR